MDVELMRGVFLYAFLIVAQREAPPQLLRRTEGLMESTVEIK